MKKEIVLYPIKELKDLREMLVNAVKNYPNHKAFIIKNKEQEKVTYTDITYKQFQEEINALGTALIDLGLKGKRIAIISSNRYEWALSYLATVNGVGIVVPLDKSLPEGEINNLLQKSEADAVIYSKDYVEIMQKIQEEGRHKIQQYIQMETTLKELVETGEELIKKGNREYLNAEIDSEAMSIILFTSGTTSAAKAVMLSHRNIISNINAMNKVIKIYDTDVNLAFLPLHHTFGSTGLLLFLCNGVTNVFCDGLRHIQSNLKEYNVTVFVSVPLLLEAMNKRIEKEIEKQGKQKKVKLAMAISNFLLKVGIDIRRKLFKDIVHNLGGSLRLVVSGAAGIDKRVAKNFNGFGIRTIQGYGLTETSPVLIAENDKYIKYGSVGLPLPGIEIRINEPNEDGIGEIIAKGPNVMAGYYENEEATKEVLKDGWFYTGDLGYQDKQGFTFVTGRKKNVIVMKNGKNIYPEELELLLAKLPYVAESMVFGIPTKEGDLDLATKIVYNKEYVEDTFGKITQEELKEKIWEDIKVINKTMPPYKYIREIIITDEQIDHYSKNKKI